MNINRNNPKCPECDSQISFIKGLRMWNPWRIICPFCGSPLEMTRISKIATILSFPLGIMYGGFAIYMEETKRWVTADSIIYFTVTIPILLGIGYLLWPLTKFHTRRGNA